MRHFLGVDAGGTKCDAVLMDETGTVLGWGRGLGGACGYQGTEVARAGYAEALARALSEAVPGEVHLGGCFDGTFALPWLEAHGWQPHGVSVSEADSAFGAAGAEWGLVVLAGTGSFVHVRTPQGDTLHLGSGGPIVSDEGGGYDVAIRGLRAALRSAWLPRLRTSLEPALAAAWEVDGRWGLVSKFQYGEMRRQQVAALAPVVEREALAGDRIAGQVLEQAAAALVELVGIALEALGLRGQGYPLWGVGGLLQGSRLYWELFAGKVREHDPSLDPQVAPARLGLGAALQALGCVVGQVAPAVRERALATQQRFPEARVATG